MHEQSSFYVFYAEKETELHLFNLFKNLWRYFALIPFLRVSVSVCVCVSRCYSVVWCAVKTTAGVIFARLWRATLLRSFLRGCMQRQGAKGRKGGGGGGLALLFLSVPFLILLFQSRGCVCSAGRCAWQCWTWVADGRQGTGATGRQWFFELIPVHACVCISVCECVVFHWPIFRVVGFTYVTMRAGLGPPSLCDVDLVCLIRALPPPTSYGHTCAHTSTQTVKVQSDIQ